MRKKFPSKRKAITIGVILAGFSASAVAQDTGDIEEVIVTGSYIRGSVENSPSPVEIIDRESIEAQGASQIWDVIRNLEVNQGSDTSTEGTNDASQLSGTASVNLRNLGGNSTLTLINGKRFSPAAVVSSSGQEVVDLNSIPLVMTDRIEVLTDGGSALYGADAVAGVVNVIMRTDFEGLELFADAQGIQEEGGAYEQTLSGIWGTSWNNGDTRLVLSGEHFERDPVRLENAQFYREGRTISNSRVGAFAPTTPLGASFNYGYLDFPLTGQNQGEKASIGESIAGTNGMIFSDPLCESLGNWPNGSFFVDNRYSEFGQRTGQCSENNLDTQFIAIGQERSSFAGSFEHTFSDSAEFYSFAQYSDTETTREWDGKSFSRTRHLFWSPTQLGVLAPYAGNAPVASPAANNPNLASNGGFGQAWYGGGVATGWPNSNSEGLPTVNKTSGVQAGLRGDFTGFDRRLDYDVSFSWSDSSIEQEVSTLLRDKTELALNGLGGSGCTPNGTPNFNFMAVPGFGALGGLFAEVFPGYVLNTYESSSLALTSNNHGQGGCQFFNPFLTSLSNPDMANSPELIDWMTQRINRADKRNELLVLDAVVSGDLIEMAGGTAAFAAGLQYRERSASGRAPLINLPGLTTIKSYEPGMFGAPNAYRENVTNNLECSSCIFNFDDQRDIRSGFIELSLPFMENVETQVAVRWEDYKDIGSAISPKIAMSWRPIDDLLLRGSYSQSFRAPNIGVVNQAFEAFSTTIQDPLRNQGVRAGLLPATNENAMANTSYTRGQANPNLGTENADTYNIGFQWTPSGDLDGLTIGADAWLFKIEDRVLPTVPRGAINPEIEKFNSVVGNEANYVLNDSLPLDARDSAGLPTACSPSGLSTEFGAASDERLNCVVNPSTYQVAGVDRLVGSTNAEIVTLILPAINSGTYQVQGVDARASYVWGTEWGQFRVGLDYTHIDEYVVDIPGLELGLQATGKMDAAGVDGEQNIVRPVPDNKGTLSFSWSRNNHRVSVFNRHTGSFQVLSHNAFMADTGSTDILKSFAKSKTDSYATWDVQYSYTHNWARDELGTANFTFGIIDVTDEDVPLYRRQAYHRSVYDARGRRMYARVLWQL